MPSIDPVVLCVLSFLDFAGGLVIGAGILVFSLAFTTYRKYGKDGRIILMVSSASAAIAVVLMGLIFLSHPMRLYVEHHHSIGIILYFGGVLLSGVTVFMTRKKFINFLFGTLSQESKGSPAE